MKITASGFVLNLLKSNLNAVIVRTLAASLSESGFCARCSARVHSKHEQKHSSQLLQYRHEQLGPTGEWNLQPLTWVLWSGVGRWCHCFGLCCVAPSCQECYMKVWGSFSAGGVSQSGINRVSQQNAEL